MARPTKPTALKLVEGNRGKRGLNKQEPDPDYLQDITPPEYLTSRARAVWDEVAPHLKNAKLLTVVDVQALAMACEAIAQYRLAVRKAGESLVKAKMVENEEGELVETGEHINPWLMVQSMAFKQANKMLEQFGMTPAARTRIAIQPQGDLFGGNEKKGSYFD